MLNTLIPPVLHYTPHENPIFSHNFKTFLTELPTRLIELATRLIELAPEKTFFGQFLTKLPPSLIFWLSVLIK
jgi:hypothetical protein